MGFGFVTINVLDGGAGSVVVPASNVQVVLGTSSAGTAGTSITATRSLTTLTSTFGYGPLVEAAALAIQAGGTVLCVRLTSASAGTSKAVQFTGTGTSVITQTTAPNDSYYVVFKVVAGGTIGVAGITFQVSLDGGRNYGPVLALGTANTYLIPNTATTLAFAAGTLVAGDVAKFQTIEPQWATAGVQTAINTLKASTYGVTGWGSMHLVGGSTAGGCPGADASTISGYLESMATNSSIYSRMFVSARDVHAPAAWGGAGDETEAQWITALQTDYAAVAAPRITAGAGYWNMPTAFPNVTAWGAPRYRRSISYAAAARQTAIPPQRMLSRVKDGAVSQIVVDQTNDPLDGFVYHDERSNPGLDWRISGSGGRFMSTMTRVKKGPVVYISHPTTCAAFGSDFSLMPFGNVIDIACTLAQSIGQDQIDSDVRLNPNGTLYENDAGAIELEIQNQLNAQMLSAGMLSPPGTKVVVSRSQNVQSTGIVPIDLTLYGKGYILSETINVAFNNPLVAQS